MGRKKEGKGEDCEKQNKKKDVTVYYVIYGVVIVSRTYVLHKGNASIFWCETWKLWLCVAFLSGVRWEKKYVF